MATPNSTSKDVYVYSTLSNDTAYAIYAKSGGDIKRVEKKILIKGGANVTDGLYTPRGVATRISGADYAILKDHPVFKLHAEGMYVTVDTAKEDAEKVSKNMKAKDGAAQLEPKDFDKNKAPKAD